MHCDLFGLSTSLVMLIFVQLPLAVFVIAPRAFGGIAGCGRRRDMSEGVDKALLLECPFLALRLRALCGFTNFGAD
jgi:hypothetical protein